MLEKIQLQFGCSILVLCGVRGSENAVILGLNWKGDGKFDVDWNNIEGSRVRPQFETQFYDTPVSCGLSKLLLSPRAKLQFLIKWQK